MAKTSEISNDLRQKIIQFHKEGLSTRKIGERLKMGHTTVQYIIRKYKKTHSVLNAARHGRPRKTNTRTDRYICQLVMKKRTSSARKIAAEVENATGTKVCAQTIRNRLNEANFGGRVARKKPFISKRNRQKRLKFAKEHVNKPDEFWDSIIWSDESKFNMFGSDGKKMVWRHPGEEYKPECLNPTVKHGGGNVLVWGCMASAGIGYLHFIEGIMDSAMYEDILNKYMLPSAKKLLGRKYIFQHDCDPKHTSKRVKAFLAKKRVKVLEWPPQSPDLNPIEHLWQEVKFQRQGQHASNKEGLKTLILNTWNSIQPSVCQKLVASMRKRCEAVIQAKGGPTRY